MSKKSEKKATAESGVVTGSFRNYSLLQKMNLRRSIAVAIVIAAIAAGLFIFLHKADSDKKEPTGSRPQTNGSQASYPQQLAKDISVAQKAVDASEKDVAAKNSMNSNGGTTQSQAAQSSKETLANNYIELGDAYYNSDNPKAAIAAYNNALQTTDAVKREALRGLLYAYSADNQIPQAIKAGEDLIAHLQPLVQEDPYVGARIKAYQSDVDRLKTGQQL